MVEAIRLLFTKPVALIHFGENLTKRADGANNKSDYAELYSIGVVPAYQGKGVGGRLLSENEHIVRLGARLSLTTVKYTTNPR